MQRISCIWTIISILLAISNPSGAMPVADQFQLDASGRQDTIFAGNTIGQTFTVGKCGVLDSIELSLFKEGSPGELTIEILELSGGDIGTAPTLGSVSINENELGPRQEVLSLDSVRATLIDVSPLGIEVQVGDLLGFRLTASRNLPNYYVLKTGLKFLNRPPDLYKDGRYFMGTTFFEPQGGNDAAFKTFVVEANSVTNSTVSSVVGTYEGLLDAETTDCVFDNGEPAEDDDAFTFTGAIAINSQNEEQFSGTGGLMIDRFGFTGQVNLTFSGTIAMDGTLGGTYAETFSLSNGFSSSGEGTFTGSVSGNTLAMQISGQDRDISGITCKFMGSFTGVDPNRETLPVVTIQATDAEAAEANSDPGSFTITRTGTSIDPLTVNYNIGGTATNGDDYNFVPSFVTIPADSSSVTITVTPKDDFEFEADETVRLTIKSDIAYTIGSADSATTIISDNDRMFTLTIVSAFGNPQGAGTYREGVQASWSVTTPWPNENGDNGIRHITTSSNGSIIMDENKTIMIDWQTQYYLDINSETEQGAELGNPFGERWYGKDTIATWAVNSPVVTQPFNKRYVAEQTGGAVKMDAPVNLDVNWILQWFLDIQTNGGGEIDTNRGWERDSTQISLTATDTENFHFLRWQGDIDGGNESTENPLSVTMNRSRAIFAIFSPVGNSETLMLELNPGWNLISVPMFPENPDHEVVLGGHFIGEIWDWRNNTFLDVISILKPTIGYWLFCSQPSNVPITGVKDTFTTLNLEPGWNLVGVTGNQGLPSGATIAWTWDGRRFRVANSLEPWKGYWIYSAANRNPTITSPDTATAPENAIQFGYTAIATDPDGDTLQFRVTGGADQSAFSIGTSSGVLSFNNAPDFEDPADADDNNEYLVEITADDGKGGSASLTVAVTVTDVFEPPPGSWVIGQGPYGGMINSLAIDSQGRLFAATGSSGCNGYSCGRNGIFRSTDGGATWSAANEGLTNLHVNSFAINSEDVIYAGTYFGGVFTSTDNGSTWAATNRGLPISSIVDVIAVDSSDTVYAGTRAGEIFRSFDNGENWEELSSSLGSISSIFIDSNDTIFAGSFSSAWRSTTGGDSWTQMLQFRGTWVASLMETQSGELLAGTTHGVLRSTDGGFNWDLSSLGFPVFPNVSSVIQASNGDLIASTRDHGFYLSLDGGVNWMVTGINSPRLRIFELQRSPANLLYAASDGGVLRSDDDGTSWAYSNENLANAIVKAVLVATDGSIFAGSGSGVARSNDLGLSWTNTSQGLPRSYGISALFELPDMDFLAGSEVSEVYRSLDLGNSWQLLGTLPGASNPVTAFARDSQGTLFATTGSGSSGSGVFRSIDGGATWTAINTGVQNTNLQSIVVGVNDTLIAAGRGVYRSVDSGANWQLVFTGNHTVWGLAVTAGAVFAASSQGVFHSTDGGINWSAVPGAPQVWVQSIAVNNTGDVYLGFFRQQPTSPSIGQYVYDSGVFAPVDDVFDTVRLTPLSLALGPAGRVYAGLSGGGVAVRAAINTEARR